MPNTKQMTEREIKRVVAHAVKDAVKNIQITHYLDPGTTIETFDADTLNTTIRVRTDYGVYYYNVKVSGS